MCVSKVSLTKFAKERVELAHQLQRCEPAASLVREKNRFIHKSYVASITRMNLTSSLRSFYRATWNADAV